MTKNVRARSRIKLQPKSKLKAKADSPVIANSRQTRAVSRRRPLVKKSQNQTSSKLARLFNRYLSHWPGLFLSLVVASGLWIFVNNVHPSQVQHTILANSYLPFIILFFLFWLFFISFLLLNSHYGLIISIWLTSWLFLRLHQVTNEYVLIGFLAGILGFVELCSIGVRYFAKNQHQSSTIATRVSITGKDQV